MTFEDQPGYFVFDVIISIQSSVCRNVMAFMLKSADCIIFDIITQSLQLNLCRFKRLVRLEKKTGEFLLCF